MSSTRPYRLLPKGEHAEIDRPQPPRTRRLLLAWLIAAGVALAVGVWQDPASGQADDSDVMVAVSCLGAGGRVDTNVHNTTDAEATYGVEFGQLSAREITVAPDDWGRLSITGRPAGDHSMTVRRNGTTVIERTVTIGCGADAPPVSSPEIQVVNACRDGNGYFLFQFVNPTAVATVSYTHLTLPTNREV